MGLQERNDFCVTCIGLNKIVLKFYSILTNNESKFILGALFLSRPVWNHVHCTFSVNL